MKITLLIGTLLIIISILPAILIFFSKLVSGKRKVIWVLSILIIPYILKEIVFAVLYVLQKDILVLSNGMVLGDLAPLIPLTWYFTSWSIYFYFKIKYETSKRKKRIKIIAGVLLIISILLGLIYSLNTYKEQEAKTILQCGSEKIFIKNSEPNKLYLSLNYISESHSKFIGTLDENKILLTLEGENSRGLYECMSYSDTFKLVYPTDSKHTKTWAWEKNTYDLNATVSFNSKESICQVDKNGYKEYTSWRVKHYDHSIDTNRFDSFVFKLHNETKHTVKAESIEYNPNWSFIAYSTAENKYIFRVSFYDLSKIIIWKFSKDGEFLKELDIKIPDKIKMKLNKSYDISHIKINDNKIQFRLYESYQGNKKQNWKTLCKYTTLNIDNI